jgi:adenylate kinase family enzyme
MTLTELGPRICIMGPSNSGKSTLAEAIAKARGLQVVHLDQLHHLPHTDWVPRPPAEFTALHDAAIAGDRWVMDGNYSRLLPQRLRRATGLILLDVPTTTSLYRYIRRCWFERDRRYDEQHDAQPEPFDPHRLRDVARIDRTHDQAVIV